MIGKWHWAAVACTSLAIISAVRGDDPEARSPVTFRATEAAGFRVASQPEVDPDTDVPPEPDGSDFTFPLDPNALEAFSQTPVLAPALAQVVSTVARQESTVGRSAAAVFVVTPEMIRRSGARSIPEALRLVPGLQVARIDANKWAITSRGFGGRFANKLLVQIDGRTVYTPLFAGTFWEVQDVLLADVERIEVIRGPGATVWGANAVNGIINVITKSAKQTHGVYVEGGGGTEERAFASGRVGGVSKGGVHWRVTGKGFERDAQFRVPAGPGFDDYRQGRVSARLDWENCCGDEYTLQGDYYQGTNGLAGTHPAIGPYTLDEPVSGSDVLFRWKRSDGDDADTTVQVFYDRTDRQTLFFDQNINILDFDLQRRQRMGSRHNVIWGLGYRRTWDNLPTTIPTGPIAVDPVTRTTELVSAYLQDEIELVEDSWYFTLGTKIEDNAFTDFEVQPSARLLWLPNQRTAVWSSVSRAVRTPSRVEDNAILTVGQAGPFPIQFVGLGNVQAENLLSYELGMRQQPADWFSWDLALFWNEYDDIVTTQPLAFLPSPPFPPGIASTSLITNGIVAESYGLEISSVLQLTEWWRLTGWYSLIRVHGVADPSPKHQAFVMSSWDVTCNVDFDMMVRYVDNVPNVATPTGSIPHYISMDLRLAWRPTRDMEVSLVGQNLLDTQHAEFGSNQFTGDALTEVQRGVYGMVSWSY